tara:strand:+ start:216 stop:767 length:552 start_codon:yes stop_codon:yes gene_type:complete
MFKNIFKIKKESSSILLSIFNILEDKNLSQEIVIKNYGAILLKPLNSNHLISSYDDISNNIDQHEINGFLNFKFNSDDHGITWAILETKSNAQLINGIDQVSNKIASMDMGDSMIGCVFIATFREQKSYIICNYRTSKFYPFIPSGKNNRDNELELDLGYQLELNKIPVENHVNWYPLWESLI